MVSRRAAMSAIAGVMGGAGAFGAIAQETAWPNKPLRIVVPSPPGATTDAIARAIGEHLRVALKQPVIVENKPGANQTIGFQAVMSSPADGHTMLLTTTELVRLPQLYPHIKYDPFVDFVPLAQLAAANAYLVVPETLGVNTLAEYLQYARRGAPVTVGNPGHGSALHYYTVLIAKNTKTILTPVAYQGTLPMVPDLLSGRITSGWITGDLVKSLEGKVKVLGVASVSERVPAFSSVPTFNEQGVPGIDIPGFIGLFARGGTPPDIADRLAAEISKSVQTPDVADLIRRTGFDPVGIRTRAEFLARIREAYQGWQNAIRVADIKL